MLLRIPLIGIVKFGMWLFVILLVDLIQMPLDNTGGHLAHLGGALFGFIYIKLLQSGKDVTNLFYFIRYFANLFKPKKPHLKGTSQYNKKSKVNSFTEKISRKTN